MSKWDFRLKLDYPQIGPDASWSHKERGVVLRRLGPKPDGLVTNHVLHWHWADSLTIGMSK